MIHFLLVYAPCEEKMPLCACVCVHMRGQLAHLLLRYSLEIAVIVPHFISFCQVLPLLLRTAGFMAVIFLTLSEIQYQANHRLSGKLQSRSSLVLKKSCLAVLSLLLDKQPGEFGTLHGL